MPSTIEELDNATSLTKSDLMALVKKEARTLHMQDIMLATSFLREDAQYMPSSYREEYIQRFSKAFFGRIRDLKNDKENYEGNVDTVKLQGFLEVLGRQKDEVQNKNELCFLKIAGIISIYTTFIREEPVHPVGTRFPGGLVLKYEKGKYLCPVKEKQLDNPSALCRFCVSVQDESVK